MPDFNVYKDISERTGGEIYVGVVGPVRTGKSTFIKRLIELMVLPAVDNPFRRERINDELPQSGAGRAIMTMQPNFVPNEAIEVELSEGFKAKIRMVDCVGYLVEGATGQMDEGGPRMVRTPWYDHDIPFAEAAEIGTQRVIREHSTIGVVLTTDGTITDIPRTSYVKSEERVVEELRDLGKPFVIVLNSRAPESDDAKGLRDALCRKYGVPVLLFDVLNMQLGDMENLLAEMLYEFPIREIRLKTPQWVLALSEDHWLINSLFDLLRTATADLSRLRDYAALENAMQDCEYLEPPKISAVVPGQGTVEMIAEPQKNLFYRILGDECGYPIEGDFHLVSIIKELVAAKREYDKLAPALLGVEQTGYGVVQPSMDDLDLKEPEIVRQGSRYGVRLKASASSLHIMRVDIETEVSPIVGSEKQSEELLSYLLSEFESDPKMIWRTNIFGKSLHELVKEGLSNKLTRMPEEAQHKMQMTLSRIINEGRNNLICILF
jgi:stage IV sporulation protein A